jgi:F0F1-type ATP synthase epsilon subunit
MQQTLSVIVRKKDGIIYRGEVKSISSTNELGAFDILPMHTNFVSIIREYLDIIDLANRHFKVKLNRGVLHAKENKVRVYLEV